MRDRMMSLGWSLVAPGSPRIPGRTRGHAITVPGQPRRLPSLARDGRQNPRSSDPPVPRGRPPAAPDARRYRISRGPASWPLGGAGDFGSTAASAPGPISSPCPSGCRTRGTTYMAAAAGTGRGHRARAAHVVRLSGSGPSRRSRRRRQIVAEFDDRRIAIRITGPSSVRERLATDQGQMRLSRASVVISSSMTARCPLDQVDPGARAVRSGGPRLATQTDVSASRWTGAPAAQPGVPLLQRIAPKS